MSKFSTIYSVVINKIKTIIPNSKELLHPYDLEVLNKDDNLAIGFGLTVGSAEVENHYFYRRNIGVVLTRRYKQGARVAKEGELIDEAHSIALQLIKELTGCSLITSVNLLGDSGIEFFEDNKYLTTTLNLELFYQESLYVE
jgi:hypothetical protein